MPTAARLHRASKRADRVMVFTHKSESSLRKEWSSRAIHAADDIEVVRLPAALIGELASRLDRDVHWYLTLQEGGMSVAEGEDSLDGTLERLSLATFLAA